MGRCVCIFALCALVVVSVLPLLFPLRSWGELLGALVYAVYRSLKRGIFFSLPSGFSSFLPFFLPFFLEFPAEAISFTETCSGCAACFSAFLGLF